MRDFKSQETERASPRQPDLAVVIPVYNEEEVVSDLVQQLAQVMDSLAGLSCMICFIDDGSTDRTINIIQEKANSDKRFQWIRLSRNFGLQAALTAGLAEVEAEAIVFMDADLQDPPDLIPALVAKWREGADVVLAKRYSREEKGLKGLLLRLFHLVLPRLITSGDINNTGNFGLLSRRTVTALRKLPERNRYYPGLRAWIGFNCAVVHYNRKERQLGTPKQSLKKLIRYAADAVFSFSYIPLRFLTMAGMIISGTGFILGLYFAVKRLAGIESAFTGFTTIVVLTVCLGGFQLIALGVIGEYLLRIYEEVKGRPPYIIESSSRLNRHDESDPLN